MDPEQLAEVYAEMLRRQRFEEQAAREQGAYSGQPDAPVVPAPGPLEQIQRRRDELAEELAQQALVAGRAKEGTIAAGRGWVDDRLREQGMRDSIRFNPDVQLDTSQIQDRRAEPPPRYPSLENYPVRSEPFPERRWPRWWPREMARGGLVTEPTLALIGEDGPEAVVPLVDTAKRYAEDLRSTLQGASGMAVGSPLNDAEQRRQLLLDKGWTEEAADRVQQVPTTVWQAGAPTSQGQGGGPLGEYLSGPVSASVGDTPLRLGRAEISMWDQPVTEALAQGHTTVYTGEPLTRENVYEHEAHHAYNDLNPANRGRYESRPFNPTPDVLEDLNAVRSYAAKRSDSELFDVVNEALDAWGHDPLHLNHYANLLANSGRAPAWYQEKYLGYQAAAPDWQGVEARSAELDPASERTRGAPPPPPERTPIARQVGHLPQPMSPGFNP